MGKSTTLQFALAYSNHCPNTSEMTFELTTASTWLSCMLTVVFNEGNIVVKKVSVSDKFKSTLPEEYQDGALSIQKALSDGVIQFLDMNPFEKSYFIVSVEVTTKGTARHTLSESCFVRYPMNNGTYLEFATSVKAAVAQAIHGFNEKNAKYQNMLKPIELQIRRLIDQCDDTILYNAVLSDTFAIHPMDNRPQDEFSFCTMNVITDITNSAEIECLTAVMYRLRYNDNDLMYTEATEFAEKRGLYYQYMDA